jgi:hypothetical protein
MRMIHFHVITLNVRTGGWNRYDLVHSPVAYCVGVPSIENVTEGGSAGEDELEHVHMLLVEQDVCRVPLSDQIPCLDCGGFPALSSESSGGGGGGNSSGTKSAHVWQPGTSKLAERLAPFVTALKAGRSKQEAVALAAVEGGVVDQETPAEQPSGSQMADSRTQEVDMKTNVSGVLRCFTAHMSAMLDAISAEVAATRHAQRIASLKRGGSSGSSGTAELKRQQSMSGLRFLRELAGTQMFAMHCFSAKGKLDKAADGAAEPYAAAGAAEAGAGKGEDSRKSAAVNSSAAADHFIEEFVVAAANWGMALEPADIQQEDEAMAIDRETEDMAGGHDGSGDPTVPSLLKTVDSQATEESDDVSVDGGGSGEESEGGAAGAPALTRAKSLQMMV